MKRIAVVAFIVGAAILLFLVLHAGFPVLLKAFTQIGARGLLLAAGVHACVIALLGSAWWNVARAGQRPALVRFVWSRAVRDSAAEALPFSQLGGYVIGARALTLCGAIGTAAAASTLLDLVIEFAAKVPYLLLGLLLLALLRPDAVLPSAIAAVVICGLSAVAILQVRPVGWPARLGRRLSDRWPKLAGLQSHAIETIAKMAASRTAMWQAGSIHFLCWLLGAFETWLILWLMQRPASIGEAVVIDSLVGALRAVSFFVPGALGVQEGGYVLLGGLFGIAPAPALALSLVRRARDLLLAFFVLPTWQWAEGRALPGRFKS